MLNRLMAFRNSQRSAVAMIFALSFVPLIYLVGLSVDYTFYSLAANQALLAAQGAATNAVRAAASTYTLETNAGVPASTGTPNAYADGVTAGEQAGYMWFLAQLGQLPRGSVSYTGTPNAGGSAVTASGYPDVTVGEPSSGGGYTATVKYTLSYPPLFNGLFSRSTNWVASGNTQATSNFDYAEILFLLDSSNSMLIGTDVNDINAMQYNSVCQSSNVFDSTIWTGQGLLTNGQYDAGTISNNGANDHDTVNFSDVTNYTASGSTGLNGSCNSKSVTPPSSSGTAGGGGPMIVCALACHSSSTASSVEAYTGDTTVYSEDLYGEARRLRNAEIHGGSTYAPYTGGPTGLTGNSPYASNAALSLRIDIVMDSAYTAIMDMETAEAFTGQFSAGVYNFTTDISTPAIATGIVSTSSSVPPPESTSLTTAAAAVKAIDYIQTPTETSFPPVYNSGQRNTDFATAMNDLRSGKTQYDAFENASVTNITGGGTAIAAVSGSTVGQTAANPLKFLFIITDGLQDPPCSGCDKFGEMTSYNAETTSTDTNAAVCKPYKTLGFTIYVLAIQYYPLSSTNYYTAIDKPTAYTVDDYPSSFSSNTNTSVQDMVTTDVTSSATTPPNTSTPQLTPVEIGLQACATSNSDFYTAAGGATSISNAINTMLRSALAQTIRLSN